MSILRYKQAIRALEKLAKSDVPKILPEAGEVAAITGVPTDALGQRVITIFSPARNPMQSGRGNTEWQGAFQRTWKLQLEPTQKWQNPYMGWTGTNDALEHVLRGPGMSFDTKDEAVSFCELRGWAYRVEEPPPVNDARPKRFLGYGDNFSVKRKGVPVGGLRSETEPVPAAPDAPAARAAPAKGRGKKAAASS